MLFIGLGLRLLFWLIRPFNFSRARFRLPTRASLPSTRFILDILCPWGFGTGVFWNMDLDLHIG